jgi:hypothetical protein
MNRLSRHLLFFAVLLMFLLSGLATQAQTTEPPDQYYASLPLVIQAGEPASVLSPRSINVTPDTANSAQAEVGSDGGQLRATGADGVTYTLVIPAGALAYTQTLTLTPSATVSGVPLSGGALAAVQIAPADLVLMQAATLTVSTPVAPDEALTSYGFGFDGTGMEFHLRTVDETSALQSVSPVAVKIITLRVPKLRGYGVASGKPTEVTHYRQRNRPTRIADQIAEDDLFVPIDVNAGIATLEKSHGQMMGLLSQSANNPGLIEDAVVAYVEWINSFRSSERLREHFASHKQQFIEGLRAAIKNASGRAYQRCVTDHNAAEGLRLQRWLYYLYTYALPMDPSYLEALVSTCFTFELKLSAKFERDGTSTVGDLTKVYSVAHVEALVRLRPQMNYPQFRLVGQSELTVHAANVSASGACSASFAQGMVAPVRVIDMQIIPSLNGRDVQVASLLFATGTGIEGDATFSCGESSRTDYFPLYAHEFAAMHDDELVSGTLGGVFRLKDHWKPGTGEQIATTDAAYHRQETFPGGYIYIFTETTTFEIYHRPQ